MNFNKILMKNVTCDNIKSHKKSRLQNLSKNSEKPKEGGRGGGAQNVPPLPRFFRVKEHFSTLFPVFPILLSSTFLQGQTNAN